MHPDVIRNFANQLASIKPTSIYAGQSTTKFPAGEQFAQVFFTVGWMTGNVGKPGANVSWIGPEPNFTAPLVTAGKYGDTVPVNPVYPDMIVFCADINTQRDWDCLEYSEAWQSIVDGEYGRDVWPGGKRPIDIRMIYHGHGHFLNSMPNAKAGIEAHRKVDFVMASCLNYNTNAHYADLVFPISTLWERHGQVFTDNREHVLWWQQVMEPLFESRADIDVAYGLAERLGLDPDEIYGNSWEQKAYNTLAGTQVIKRDGSGYEPLVTITAQDIKDMGVEGEPQKGRITIEEFREKGIYKVPREADDALMHIAHAAFIADPEANPVATSTGKFEIYCPTLAAMVNQYGFSTIYPIGKYQEAEPDQGYHARTEEYPLILFTPHSLRRAHTNLDNVPALREAFPQECFMSVVDAEARGLKTDDVVLMSSPHGKVIRRVKVLPGMVPGAVALEDGAWIDIDNETGIDRSGNPNILQAPRASGQGVQCWTGTLLQVEKYDGDLVADYKRPAREIRFAKDSD
ncbi:molybdopterin-dependent oxidoreductase [Aggregatilinea sp.]|uniref:molybdopterin-dependent oxidoreductase n=1 Tax=Aggregatilinea sp. TaxID=2806333 RepID=UPI002D1F9A8B|nr:molybdopterin-dependent oxidoreductase [Aggregatilinea sp.]